MKLFTVVFTITALIFATASAINLYQGELEGTPWHTVSMWFWMAATIANMRFKEEK